MMIFKVRNLKNYISWEWYLGYIVNWDAHHRMVRHNNI